MKRIRKSNQRHYWVLPSSYRVFVDFTSYYEFFFDFEQAGEVYRVFTGFYRLLPGFLSAFVVLEVIDLLASLPSFTGFYILLPSLFLEITEFYWVLQIVIGFYRPLNWVYRVLLGFTDYDRVSYWPLSFFEVVDLLASLPSFTGFSQTRAECVWFDILPSFAKSKTFHNSTTIDINNCL